MKHSEVRWRKSSHSGEQGNCVEVGAWRKSSYSAQEGECVEVGGRRASTHSSQEGHCVEVGRGEAVVLARDSKDPDGPVLGFGADAWSAFLDTVKSGRLDLI
jgi:hypothetical protein